MLKAGELVLKLPGGRVAELVAAGQGHPFGAAKGRPRREWVALAPVNRRWRSLAEEALAFVASGS